MVTKSALAALAVGLCTSLAVVPVMAQNQNATTNVTVNPTQPKASIPETAIGLNTAVWDPNLMDASIPSMLRSAGIKVLRYPGGSTSDIYQWKTNSITKGQSSSIVAKDNFKNFMKLVRKSRAQAMITVNYGTNPAGTGPASPAYAAAWVKYANVTHHDNVKYWEIGNEIYGDGFYGSSWEADLHKDKGPAAYAKYALQFIDAMKKVDPSIKIGIVVTAPGNWPDGQTPSWNNTVLKAIGDKIDFVDVHWYAQQPGHESDAGLLASTTTIPGMVQTLKNEIQRDAKGNAKNVQIMTTETNSVAYNPGKQSVSVVNALFLVKDYATWLSEGVANVDWWDLHNSITTGTNNSPALYGNTNYGDYGVLSSGTSSGALKEPPANTPFPAYYALEMLHHFIVPGDSFVSASSSNSDIVAYGARQGSKSVSAVVLNQSPDTSHAVSVDVKGWKIGHKVNLYTYGENTKSIQIGTAKVVAGNIQIVLPPYTMVVVRAAKA